MWSLRKWRDGRNERKQNLVMEEIFNEEFGRPGLRHIRRWSREELHERIVSGDLKPVELHMAQSVLKRRESWDAPAGRAYYLSVIAIIISAVSLLVSILK